MKKNINKKINIKIKRKYITLIEILVLFMVAGLTMQIAVAGSSETNKATEKATAPVLSPENPDFVQYHEDKIHSQSTASVKKDKKGFMPASVDLNYLSDISTTGISAPAYYDLRTLNKVTSVKDQGEEGVCWVFATFASLESYLMPGESRDFSENNMKNLLSSAYPEGFDCEPDEGGNPLMSTAYLARWSGPVDETDDPYSIYSGESPQDLPVQKHVQNVLFIPDRKSPLDNDEIKSAILQYGVLCTSMYFDDACFSPTRYSHYYSGPSISDHAVSIVGWDDKFSRDNFSIIPPGDGAFIVKNSWGTGWGDNGYFYVSYYDSNIGTNNAVFTAETTENYKKIYQYDPLGWIQSVGYDSPTAWCANVFTAKTDETLEAVSFYAADSNCDYEIYIYIDPESGPVREEGPAFSKSGTIGTAGYHTVPLGSEVQLGAGQKFSVVLKLTTPYCSYPVAVETPFEGFSSKATANLGESFVSEDGNTWEDINVYYPDSNICIKAFTDSRSIPVFPGYTNPPTDLDRDGLYEDINGNGILDFDDVVAYYDNMEWIEENVPVELFDYNNNGLIDFDDVVKLYDML